ncbi:MAG: DUF748 domain-containing protein [Nitrospiraceae bacterium]
MRKALWWLAGILGALALIGGLTLAFIDEPLRGYVERELNRRVHVYTFRVGDLDVHPLSFSVDLQDLVMTQKSHPDPPIVHIQQWRASIHWRKLLTGHMVSDHSIERPILRLTRAQFQKHVKADKDKARAWQEMVRAIYPFEINELTITNGDISYQDSARARPLRVSELNFKAGNIRNIESQDGVYPSDIHLDSHMFEHGRLTIDGSADFLAQPHLGLNAEVQLDDVDLNDLISLAGRYRIQVREGMLSAKGHVEYAPRLQVIRLTTLKMHGVRLDYVHTSKPNEAGKQLAKKAAQEAQEASNHPELLLQVDQGSIENSEFGFINKAVKPEYRIFLSGTDMYLENFSNQLSEGAAVVRLRGMFMGNGPVQANGIFRPEINSPDFDLDIRIIKAQVKSMNDILRAHGDFDVTSGLFSLYTEFKVKDGGVNGYIKPLFKDLDVYDPAQDKNKGLLGKIYEGIVGGVSGVLENAPRDEVATKAEVSGPLKTPQASTWQVVVKLIQNAFFEAIVPGFER